MSCPFRCARGWKAALALSLLSAFPGIVPIAAQESASQPAGIVDPWVVVIVPETAEDDARTETLALVVADTVEMTLRLIGDYAVQPRPEGDAAPGATEVAEYAERERMDYVVFGEVGAGTGSETRFRLSVYSREAGAVTLEREAIARSLFDTFSVADELSAELLGAFTGQRIAYGRVELRNQADVPGAYRVYLDGSPAGTSVTTLDRVLVGEREVAVEAREGPRAGTVVASRPPPRPRRSRFRRRSRSFRRRPTGPPRTRRKSRRFPWSGECIRGGARSGRGSWCLRERCLRGTRFVPIRPEHPNT